MKAIGSNREVNLSKLGKPAVLLFHTQETADDAAKVNAAVRAIADYDTPEKLFVANVVDLHSIPKLFRGFAENAMKDSYKQAAATLPKGVEPASMVLILPDWDGGVTKSVGLKDTNKNAGAAVLNAEGKIISVVQSKMLETEILTTLKEISK